jgi:hypothetical protein
MILFLSALAFLYIAGSLADSKTVQKKKTDPYDNKGNTPFFLQDARDSTCLGPNGFTICDERALWILTRRVDKKETYSLVSFINPKDPKQDGICLEQKSNLFGLVKSDNVGMGSCSREGAKNWEFEFIDKTRVKISTKSGMCIVRGKKQQRNSVSLAPCGKTDPSAEYLPLTYHPAEVHTAGLFVQHHYAFFTNAFGRLLFEVSRRSLF